MAWVWHQAKRVTETRHPCIIVLPDHLVIQHFMRFVAGQDRRSLPHFPPDTWKKYDYSAVNEGFLDAAAGVCLQYLGNGHVSLEDSNARRVVYVMTYHSIKGLDFRTVFLPLLTPETKFWKDPDIDRRLFFVGATRSRRDLFMSYHGSEPHPYVQGMTAEELHKMEIAAGDDQNDDGGFTF